jgi:crotonobetainyl-CoA:carnitine CoA-transferase CaiB-like acyl-CoA transferase
MPMGAICGQRTPATGDSLTHAPHLGEHTREVLGEMGFGAGEIEKLSASGVVACYRG